MLTHGIKQLGIRGYSSISARFKVRCNLTGTSIAAQPISYRQTLVTILRSIIAIVFTTHFALVVKHHVICNYSKVTASVKPAP